MKSQKYRQTRWTAIALLWIATLVLVGVALGVGGPARRYAAIAADGGSTIGAVTAKESTDHQLIRYEFAVGSNQYQGSDVGAAEMPRFETIAVGDPILVSFARSDPTVSMLGSPRDRLSAEIYVDAAASVALATTIVGAMLLRRRWQ